jgi:hypothetical protein
MGHRPFWETDSRSSGQQSLALHGWGSGMFEKLMVAHVCNKFSLYIDGAQACLGNWWSLMWSLKCSLTPTLDPILGHVNPIYILTLQNPVLIKPSRVRRGLDLSSYFFPKKILYAHFTCPPCALHALPISSH